MSSFLSRFTRISLVAACGAGLAALTTGCGIGNVLPDNMTDGTSVGVSGVVHGGPNPIAHPYLYLYATGNSSGVDQGYGAAGTLLNTTVGDANGNFVFGTGGGTCPAGQFAYLVVQGGASGGNAHNPNYLLMAALGPCSSISGARTVLVNELTTAVAAYTLANFMTVTASGGGTPVAAHYVGGTYTPADGANVAPSPQFVVNVGAPATNNAAAGTACDAASGYPTTCATTATSGLAHAFANAASLIDTSDAYIPATTGTGGVVPVAFLYTLGNVLQACVNSTGGGTNTGSVGTDGTGTATTTTTAAGASHDGTPCGELFAFTSYTNTGLTPGTNTTNGDGTSVTTVLNAPTNTLSALLNLAKRPTGSAALFNSACASNSAAGGTTTAATCIYNITSSIGYFEPALTAAPNDFAFGIQFPQGSFHTASSTASCGLNSSGVAIVPPTNGIYYPFDVKTDINDNLTILNEDSGSQVCFNLITAGHDGSSIAANAFDTTTAKPLFVANDAYGHTIVPEAGTNQISVYQTGTDTSISTTPLVTITATGATVGVAAANATVTAATATYAVVDNSSDFLVGATSASGSNLAVCAKGSGFSHTSATYNCTNPSLSTSSTTFYTSKTTPLAIDVNNNVGFLASASTSVKYAIVPSGYTNYFTNSSISAAGGSSAGDTAVFDNTISGGTGHIFSYQGNGSTATQNFVTVASYTATTVANATSQYSGPTTGPDPKVIIGEIDGNQVMFTGSTAGTTAASPSTAATAIGNLRFYDTQNNYLSPQIIGCKIGSVNTTTCGQLNSDPNTSFLFFGAKSLAVDSTGSVWAVNSAPGSLTEVFGIAAPTLPQFVHNGTSMKP